MGDVGLAIVSPSHVLKIPWAKGVWKESDRFRWMLSREEEFPDRIDPSPVPVSVPVIVVDAVATVSVGQVSSVVSVSGGPGFMCDDDDSGPWSYINEGDFVGMVSARRRVAVNPSLSSSCIRCCCCWCTAELRPMVSLPDNTFLVWNLSGTKCENLFLFKEEKEGEFNAIRMASFSDETSTQPPSSPLLSPSPPPPLLFSTFVLFL